ncbi:MAG: hypothetical protein KJO38_08775 [Gammaproteobacteria bacterium]|nr:hypothetical protein [Gammaproteobacteria bacterium]
MQKLSIPMLAAGIGLVLALTLTASGAAGPGENYGLPLLTMLLVAELGFFVCAAGTGFGIRDYRREPTMKAPLLAGVACAALSLYFALTGLTVWQTSIAGN